MIKAEGNWRITEIDSARGIAVAMMIVYHLLFDLSFLGFMKLDLHSLPILLLQRTTGSLFVLLAGISFSLSESRNKEGYMHSIKRAALLGGVALLITVVTWIYPHEGFIRFGVIHFLALSALLLPLFKKLGDWNLLIALAMIIGGFFVSGIQTDSPYLFWLGIVTPDYYALDHYPMFPWFGIILIGSVIGRKLAESGWKGTFIDREWMVAKAFGWLGRNSLTIYLLHQPILIGVLMLLSSLGILR